jgi:antitoxin HicB
MVAPDHLTIDEYMEFPYRMEVYWDEDYWAAEFPELPGLAAGHETWAGLQEAVQDAKRAYFESAIEARAPIPLPQPREQEFSGRSVVRMARSMHRDAVRAARREGVSLNTFICTAVAKELGRQETPRPTRMFAIGTGHPQSFTGRKAERWATIVWPEEDASPLGDETFRAVMSGQLIGSSGARR